MPWTDKEQAIWKEYESNVAAWMFARLGISEKFTAQLPHDDDWTTIVKLHAMVEAALNQMVLHQFGNPELAKVIERLETSNPKTGKLAFIKAFNILPEENIQFITKLSQLRNACVHKVRNFSFDLSAYVAAFDKDQRKKWIELLTFESAPRIEGTDGGIDTARVAVIAPRISLIGMVYQILFRAWIHERECERRQLKSEERRLMTERFAELSRSTPKK